MILYDSTNGADIPSTAEAVAGYIDGAYITWTPDEWARFANVPRLRIAIFATDDADVLDVETYDATPDKVGGWTLRQKRFVWIYCNRSNRSAVEFNLNKTGLKPSDVGLWIATLDGTKIVDASPYGYDVCAVQYANSIISGGHFDESIIYGELPGGSMATEQDIVNAIKATFLDAGINEVHNDLEEILTQLKTQPMTSVDVQALTQAVNGLNTTLQRIEAGFKAT